MMEHTYTYKEMTKKDYQLFIENSTYQYMGDQLFTLLDGVDIEDDNPLFIYSYSIYLSNRDVPIGIIILIDNDDYFELAFYYMNDIHDEDIKIDALKTFIKYLYQGIFKIDKEIIEIISYCSKEETIRIDILRKVGFKDDKETTRKAYIPHMDKYFDLEGYVYR